MCREEKLEDTKEVIRSAVVYRKRTENKMVIRKGTKRQTMIHKTKD